MHMYIMMLERVARRYAPSRPLSFDLVHVFVTLQRIGNKGITSRNALCRALVLGEGTVKTLVKHLRCKALLKHQIGAQR